MNVIEERGGLNIKSAIDKDVLGGPVKVRYR